MSKKDYFNTKSSEILTWKNHQVFQFKHSADMLEWVSHESSNFTLSDKVYDAMVDCLENSIESIIVATIKVDGGTDVDVLIRKDNFQKILNSYVQKLLNVENYEKLQTVKSQMEKYNLEFLTNFNTLDTINNQQ